MQNENTERNSPFSKGVILTLLYFGHHFNKLKDNAQGREILHVFTCNTYQFWTLLLCHCEVKQNYIQVIMEVRVFLGFTLISNEIKYLSMTMSLQNFLSLLWFARTVSLEDI